jgi:nicotinate phosphoribosyltransferase
VRSILDDGGLQDVRILASGDLDEHRIADLLAADAPVDAFGVGTRMGTSGDAPSLGVVYKLVADDNGPKLKLAEGKATWPGRKQVFRCDDHDVLGLINERVDGRGLLVPAVREPLEDIRERCRTSIDALPERLRALGPADPPYKVRISPGLDAMQSRLAAEHRR